MSPLGRGFVAQLERFVAEHGLPLVQFRKGERKDAVMAEHLRRCAGEVNHDYIYAWTATSARSS
jgi:hypothetical protein